MTGNLLIAVLLAQPTSAPNVPGSQPTTVPATEVFSWAKGTFLGNNLWQWLGLLGVLLVSMVVGKLICYFLQRQADRFEAAERRKVLGMVLRGLAGPTRLWALAVGLYAADLFMTFAEKIADFWWRVCAAIAVLAGAWLIYRLVEVVEHLLLRWTARTKTRLDDQLVPMVRKTLRVFVLIVAALVIAQNIFEMQIGAMLAGLGIGGLAFALAARDTVANFFGSLTIFVDRPFQLGHRIKLAGYDGFVEEVGFRSTRVRTLDGHLVSIPNAKIASDAVENISRRPSIRRVLDVTVTYDTPPEKVQRGVEILREMLEARKAAFPDDFPPRVYFSDYNAASLNIVVYYWFTPPDWWEYLAFNHDFNTELLRRFNDEGIEFAFPTQTLYLKQDSPIAADVNVTSSAPS